MTTPSFYACEFSLSAGEQLFGTAPRVDVWVLLEYRAAYSRDVFPDSDIPAPVKEHINRQLKSIPNTRLQLIKQDNRVSGPLTFYVAVAYGIAPRLYRFTFDRYEDLLTLDLSAIVAGKAERDALSAELIFLVCTNGKRDKCCSKFGMPVYRDLVTRVGENAWQTNHLGGHRFAATAVALPFGITYGRIASVEHLVNEYRDGKLALDYYRGRSCYAEPVQAADYYLRRETQHFELTYFEPISVQATDKSGWQVEFRDAVGNKHALTVIKRMSDFPIRKNSDDPAQEHVPQFELTAYEQRKNSTATTNGSKNSTK